MSAQLSQRVCNLLRSQHEVHATGLDCVARHAGKSCGLGLLGEDDAAALLDCAGTARAVGVSAGEHDTDGGAAKLFGEGHEKTIDRQVQTGPARPAREAKTLLGDCKSGVRRNDVEMTRLDVQVVSDLHDRHGCLLCEELG